MRYQMLKRDIRLFLHCLLPALVLTAVFAAACAMAAMAASDNSKDVYTPVKAAVVDGESSVFSRLLIRMVAKTDYISEFMEVSSCDMDTAMAGIEDGEFAAAIILPEGTFDGIMSGEVTKGQIYLAPSVAGYTKIVQRVAAFGELFLAAGQYGIFSGQQLIGQYELENAFHSQFLADANAMLLNEALGANSSYFDIEILGYAGTRLSTEAYFLTCWLALLVMLLPLFFARLYTNDLKKPILCRLRGLGVDDGSFLLGKAIYPAAFQMLIVGLVLCITKDHLSPAYSFGAILTALLGIVAAAAVCGFLMMLGHRGVPILIVTVLSGLLLCGGIVPRQMLPDTLHTIGSITPYGVVQSLLMPIWGGQIQWPPCAMGVVYTAAAAFAARARLQYVRIGGDDL